MLPPTGPLKSSNKDRGRLEQILAGPEILQLITADKRMLCGSIEVNGTNDGAIMKIGFLSMPLTGHLNPMTALAR